MRSAWNLWETLPVLEQFFEGGAEVKSVLLTEREIEKTLPNKLWYYARDIHVKTRDGLQSTDLDNWGFLGTDKVWYTIQSELEKKISKLLDINRHIK